MSDILIPMPRDPRGHDMHDDCADWAVSNVRPFIPQGADQQGRYTPTYPAEAASSCTEIGADDFEAADKDYSRFVTGLLMVVIYGLSCLMAFHAVRFIATTIAEAAP